MTSTLTRATMVACTLALAAATAPAWAGSFASSASSAGSASLDGSSNSIEGSSQSSSDDKTALVQDGAYRVTTVTPNEQGDTVRLGLMPQDMAGAEAFVLNVPVGAFGGQLPVVGEVLQAQRRDYGVQFARAEQPFYLVLADAWNAELQSRPLTP